MRRRREGGGGLGRLDVEGDVDVLDVSDLPDQGPIISGSLPRYKKGDLISANCTSAGSVPAATLNW